MAEKIVYNFESYLNINGTTKIMGSFLKNVQIWGDRDGQNLYDTLTWTEQKLLKFLNMEVKKLCFIPCILYE